MSWYALAEPLAKSGEAAKSGPIGFAVILVLCVACYFLFKSMSKHLRKVREEFPTDEPPTSPAPAAVVRADDDPAASVEPESADVEHRET
jgi:hypothetical protein